MNIKILLIEINLNLSKNLFSWQVKLINWRKTKYKNVIHVHFLYIWSMFICFANSINSWFEKKKKNLRFLQLQASFLRLCKNPWSLPSYLGYGTLKIKLWISSKQDIFLLNKNIYKKTYTFVIDIWYSFSHKLYFLTFFLFFFFSFFSFSKRK
jgi:hypothetical protein